MPVALDVSSTVTAAGQIGPLVQGASATVTGTTVDLVALGYRDARVLLVAGLGSRTDGSFTFSLEQSDDDSSYSPLTPFSGSLTAVAAADTTRKAAYEPTKRYVRAKSVSTGITTGATQFAVVVVLPPAL